MSIDEMAAIASLADSITALGLTMGGLFWLAKQVTFTQKMLYDDWKQARNKLDELVPDRGEVVLPSSPLMPVNPDNAKFSADLAKGIGD